MTAKEELLKFIFDNEFITKPRLKNDFELLVNKVIDEAQQQVKILNIPAVSVCLERAKKYGRHQHYLDTVNKPLVEWEEWEAKD